MLLILIGKPKVLEALRLELERDQTFLCHRQKPIYLVYISLMSGVLVVVFSSAVSRIKWNHSNMRAINSMNTDKY